ncbi:MAG: TylF/MycF/NovP-related O-methyltransferase [Bacteroidales bacterium]
MIKKIRNNILEKLKEKSCEKIYQKYRPYTMIPKKSYITTLNLISKMYTNGAIVECGVWKGGMIAGIAEMLGNICTYYLFDSFEGLPEAKEIDGEAAIKWQKNKQNPSYYDNCKASEKEAVATMKLSNVDSYKIIKGWYKNTLPDFVPNEPIGVLHIDADWYDSVILCFDHLYKYVQHNGLIIIDDYYVWDGTSKAVHDFLSKIQSASKIYSLTGGIAYIIKKDSHVLL